MQTFALTPDAFLYHADCRDAVKALPDNSIDSVVTDPPYALTQASRNGSHRNNDPETPFGRTKLGERGFMGKTWDTGEVAFAESFWREVWRVLKPGGHVAAFGASRGYHRMTCAIEDAGFEIRDSLMWVYGTGFPKSQDVSKFIDKSLGAERERVKPAESIGWQRDIGNVRPYMLDPNHTTVSNVPASAAAAEWQGWGTALKPAFEPIVLARKPLSEGTVAANVMRWGTGALNIDATRVPTTDKLGGGGESADNKGKIHEGWQRPWMADDDAAEAQAARVRDNVAKAEALGRWPTNVVHDGSAEVIEAFPSSGPSKARRGPCDGRAEPEKGWGMAAQSDVLMGHNDQGGSAARFFYSAKASKADRAGSKHPTVKPVALMEWLATLITPPGGVVLDPFAGSGTTGAAALNKGFCCVLVEREAEYVADIQRRLHK